MVIIAKSRAEYLRKRRENKKTFSVLIDKVRFDKLEHKLQEEDKTKKQWLEENIDNYTKK